MTQPLGTSALASYQPGAVADYGDGEGVDESPLLSYWRIFYRHRRAVLFILAATLLLSVIVSVFITPRYTATTQIQVERQAAKVVDVGSIDDTLDTQSAEFYATQYELLRSRSLAEAVVRDLRLTDNTRFATTIGKGKFAALSRPERTKKAVNFVIDARDIAPVAGSHIIKISATTVSPELSQAIANSYAKNFIDTTLERRYEASGYARDFLKRRLDSVRAKLEESERKAAEYARNQGLVKISGGTNPDGSIQPGETLTSAQLSQLSQELAAARVARGKAEADLRANNGGAAAATALSNEAINALRRQRAELSGELSKLLSDFGPEYPKVRALTAQVAEVDRQIAMSNQLISRSIGSDLNDKYRQAVAAEQRLVAEIGALKNDVLDQQQRSIGFNIIQRDVDTNRSLYEALLQRFKEVGIAGGIGTNNVSIVDGAQRPQVPTSPNLPLNAALGLLAGLALSVAYVLVRDQLSETMVTADDFQKRLGVPLLGSTPMVAGAQDHESAADLSEAYFSVLTALQFSSPSGMPRSLLITSTQQNEGKSTTCLSLARQLAAIGSRVLLVDSDLRNSSLHRRLGIPNAHGVTDYLVGRASIDTLWQSTTVPNLSVMTSGMRPPSPVELLSGPRLVQMIAEALTQFDHVLIDGPPVLGLADAPLISRAVDGTVFIVESSRTRATQARLAMGRLRGVGSRVVGAVLTKLDTKQHGYGYGYGYDYRYGE